MIKLNGRAELLEFGTGSWRGKIFEFLKSESLLSMLSACLKKIKGFQSVFS